MRKLEIDINYIMTNMENELKKALKKYRIDIPLRYYDSIGSTNVQIKEEFFKDGFVGLAVAGEQTAGKGRADRKFLSQRGGAYFSISLKLSSESMISQMFGSVLLAGIAVCKTLKNLGVDAALKWPNDVLAGNKKICGILSGIVYDDNSPVLLVCGIGINVNVIVDKIPEAVSLSQISGNTCNIAEIIAETVKNFFEMLFDKETDLISEYRKWSITLGKRVIVHSESGDFFGTALDITSEGHLLVMTDEGIKSVFYGDVSIRDLLS